MKLKICECGIVYVKPLSALVRIELPLAKTIAEPATLHFAAAEPLRRDHFIGE